MLTDDAVEEFPVVGNQQQGARVSLQPVFQPDHRIQVEMVGGLVEQQQVGTAHQRARQVQAHAPAAGKFRHRALLIAGPKSQTMQQLSGTAAGGVAIQRLELPMQLGQPSAVARLARPAPAAASTARSCASPSSTYSIAARLSAGVSWSTCAITQSRGRRNSPVSACSSSRISANRLDFPEPLAPVTPTFCPGWICRVARFEQ